MTIEELDALVKTICPILGLSEKGEIWFHEDATEEQRASAFSVVNENVGLLQ